ncbi:MAG TPA: serine hydrolase domain-containing protein [Candidatus Limnocylindria bacterium]|nr:serine hydrolase domain-containing protein [Candidatus Limnocylindria bacterium]
MNRAARRAGPWAIAVVTALVLSLVLASPIGSPELAVLAGAASASPQAAEHGTADGRPSDEPPGPSFPHWPPAASRGELRPVRLTPLERPVGRALQAAVDRAREELGLFSLSVGVAVDGRSSWTGTSGVALDGVTPIDGDSAFAVASITKTFTAALVMGLVEDGRLSLEDRVADLLPRLGVDRAITVRHLLSHTSGLADLLIPMRKPMTAEPTRRFSGEEVIRRLGDPWFAPGAGFAYSNSNYVLLGLIVERVTGDPFARVLERKLLRPLELDETGVLLGRRAPPLMPSSWASAFGTSGYMYSSASDLLEWAIALYGGRVLEAATLEQMATFDGDAYGLGTEVIRLGRRAGIGHSGLLRGHTSLLVHLPAEGVTLVLIGTWQGFDPARALMHSRGGKPSILDEALRAAR